jgi:predicted Zn-dependent peptidase
MSEVIRSERLGEQYERIAHPSGLTILLCPMPGFSTAYALFATKYGSVDVRFKTGGDTDFADVPAGIAHFLEHKMFESEEGDAFALYAKTGASANAYTSFDRTAYLFSCSENFKESMEILLNTVTTPYFTAETVQKEQGIIGQEIKMYDDSPEWRVFFNLLGALYHENPVRVDIAGTVESIAQIDAGLLHRCYRTFYNLHNMVLAVAGNFEPKDVLDAADRILKPAQDPKITRGVFAEPKEVREGRVEQKLPVALPLFQIGFKGEAGTEAENVRGQVIDEILLDMIAGEASPLYRRLYDEGLINQTFGSEAMASRDYALCMFAGESRDPDRVFEEIKKEIERLRAAGIENAVFERVKKAVWGRYVGLYGKVEAVAGLMVAAHFADLPLYALLDMAAGLTLHEAAERLEANFDVERAAISVVRS